VRVAGQWRYVDRAIDQFGQVIDVFVTPRRDAKAARRFFQRAIGTTKVLPVEVVTDRAATYPIVLEEPGQRTRTITWDQGKEMADHADFTIATGIPVYCCDPHKPWQRGSNQHQRAAGPVPARRHRPIGALGC
jgi:IS30 family transposase